VPEGETRDDFIPKNDQGDWMKCDVYVGDGTNATTSCSNWTYFGDVGHTIVSQVVCSTRGAAGFLLGGQCPLAARGEEIFENLTTKWCILKYI